MKTREYRLPPLPIWEQQLLQAAEGWLGLGDRKSATEELARIPDAFQSNIAVQRLHIRVNLRSNPAFALKLVERALHAMPNDREFIIHRSFALKELGRVQDAFDLLIPVVDRFPEDCIIPHNLACYLCQLGRNAEALRMLARSLAVDGSEQNQLRALSDPDLAPLRSMRGFRLPCSPCRDGKLQGTSALQLN